MGQATTSSPQRLVGIDAGRMIAVCGVPFIHVVHVSAANTWVDLAFRFAVPFFFLTAGYFAARSRSEQVAGILQAVRRLAPPFLFWAAIYVLASQVPLRELLSPKALVLLLLTGQPGHHLWFLPALLGATVMLISVRRLSLPLLLAAAGALYVGGLAVGAYSAALLGVEWPAWFARNALFFAFPFMVLGFYLAKRELRYSVWLAATLFLGGGIAQAAEAMLLTASGNVVRYDLLIGTVPFGLGAFMLALKIRPSPLAERMASLGRYSLGIYAMHLLGLWIAYRLFSVDTFPASIAAGFFALATAVIVSLLLGRVPYLKYVVR